MASTITLATVTLGRPAALGIADIVFTDGVGTIEDHNFTIGEQLIFTNQCAVDLDISGKKIYYAESHFVPNFSGGKNYWEFVMPNVIAPGDRIDGVWQGGTQSAQNLTVTLIVGTNDTVTWQFQIEHTMFAGADPFGYIKNQFYNNHDYLLKNIFTNPAELDNTDLNEAYHVTPKGEYRFTLYITDTSSFALTTFTAFPLGTFNLIGKWYNKNNNNVTAEFPLNGDFDLSGSATCLSLFEERTINFALRNFSSPHAALINNMLAYMIRTDKLDNTVRFDVNYGMDAQVLQNTGGSANVSQHFRAPVVINNFTGSYESHWKIRPDTLVPGARYRIIVVAYSTNNEKMQSYISPEYSVCNTAPETPISLKHDLFDYNAQTTFDMSAESTSNALTAIQDRIMTRVVKNTTLSFSNYVAALTALLGVTPTIIPRRVKMAVYNYNTLTTYHVLDEKIWDFQNWVYDTGLSKFRANFGAAGDNTVTHDKDINHSFISDDGVTQSDFAGIYYDFRMRNEPFALALRSYVANVLVPTFGVQVWRQVKIVWSIQFEYTFNILGVPFAYGDIHEFEYEVSAEDYESVTDVIESMELQDTDGNAIQDLCNRGTVQIKIQLNLTYFDGSTDLRTPEMQNLIPLIDKVNFGIANLQEEDLYVNAVQPLLQLLSPLITGGTPLFDANGVGYIFINADLLTDTDIYRVSALVKPNQGVPPPPTNIELREDGGEELREDGGLEIRE